MPSQMATSFISLLLCESPRNELSSATGQMATPKRTTFRSVTWSTTNISKFFQFSKVTIKIPPLAEQHRIVAEIERHLTRLDASVAALKRVQANLKRYRASVLKDACEGKLVPTEAELARAEGRDYEPADHLLEAHPGRTPRPLG